MFQNFAYHSRASLGSLVDEPMAGVSFQPSPMFFGDTTTESYYKYYGPTKPQTVYLPLLSVSLRSQVLATTTRTTLLQTFHNPSQNLPIPEAKYTFPLYANCCVVSFICYVGDTKVITGVIKTKEEAKATYNKAVAQGQTAGLLEQQTTEVFTTQLGNIPAGAAVRVEIEYITELKHDAEADGIKFTVPTAIAPRYGTPPQGAFGDKVVEKSGKGISLSIEVTMAENIRSVQSTSHPISVVVGTHGSSPSPGSGETYDPKKALATLFQPDSVLTRDFVLMVTTVTTSFLSIPQALLETHPTIPNQQAMMVTLVPRFEAPPSSKSPDIIFLADRSGSMQQKIVPLKSALRVFLKSLPVHCRFNIVSFGSTYSFLWPQPQKYTRETLLWAEQHIEGFAANMDGTELLAPMQEIVKRMEQDGNAGNNTEVMVLTDGEIWGLDQMLLFIKMSRQQSKNRLRVFSLGIGPGVSHALVEGMARMGGGFSQVLAMGEEHWTDGALEGKVVTMLKSALTDHIDDYKLDVVYQQPGDETTDDSDDSNYSRTPRSRSGRKMTRPIQKPVSQQPSSSSSQPSKEARTVNLFDPTKNPERISRTPEQEVTARKISDEPTRHSRFSHLRTIAGPEILQAPCEIPTLFPFERSVVYLLFPPSQKRLVPKSVTLRATNVTGDELVVSIPVTCVEAPGTTIHQLGARMLLQDFEEGRSWIHSGRYGVSMKETDETVAQYVDREGEDIAVKWGIASKWTSFVAIEEEILQEVGVEASTGDSTIASQVEESDKKGYEDSKGTMNTNGHMDSGAEKDTDTDMDADTNIPNDISTISPRPGTESLQATMAAEMPKMTSFMRAGLFIKSPTIEVCAISPGNNMSGLMQPRPGPAPSQEFYRTVKAARDVYHSPIRYAYNTVPRRPRMTYDSTGPEHIDPAPLRPRPSGVEPAGGGLLKSITSAKEHLNTTEVYAINPGSNMPQLMQLRPGPALSHGFHGTVNTAREKYDPPIRHAYNSVKRRSGAAYGPTGPQLLSPNALGHIMVQQPILQRQEYIPSLSVLPRTATRNSAHNLKNSNRSDNIVQSATQSAQVTGAPMQRLSFEERQSVTMATHSDEDMSMEDSNSLDITPLGAEVVHPFHGHQLRTHGQNDNKWIKDNLRSSQSPGLPIDTRPITQSLLARCSSPPLFMAPPIDLSGKVNAENTQPDTWDNFLCKMGDPRQAQLKLDEGSYTARETLDILIRLQKFDGSYLYSLELMEALALLDTTAVMEFMSTSSFHATALVALYLSKKLEAFREMWELIVQKAWEFVDTSNIRDVLEEKAMALVMAEATV